MLKNTHGLLKEKNDSLDCPALSMYCVYEEISKDRVHYIYKFPNTYGASIVQDDSSYGGKDRLYELAVIRFGNGNLDVDPETVKMRSPFKMEISTNEYEIVYHTSITDDVIGWLTWKKVVEILEQIKDLQPGVNDYDLDRGEQIMDCIPVEYNVYKELVEKANKWDEHDRKIKELELERYINKLIGGEVVYPFKDRLLLVESTLVEAIKNGIFFDFSNVKSKLHYSILTYIQGTDDRFFKWETGTVDALTFSVFRDGASDLYRWQSEINEIIERIPWKNLKEDTK